MKANNAPKARRNIAQGGGFAEPWVRSKKRARSEGAQDSHPKPVRRFRRVTIRRLRRFFYREWIRLCRPKHNGLIMVKAMPDESRIDTNSAPKVRKNLAQGSTLGHIAPVHRFFLTANGRELTRINGPVVSISVLCTLLAVSTW